MKKIFTAFLLLATICLDAKPFLCEFNQVNPHRIYFGPEFFLFDLKTSVDVEEVYIQGNKGFVGLRIGYEYLKPQFLYVGLDVLGAVSKGAFPASIPDGPLQNNNMTAFANVDARLGYSFVYKNALLTPFLGMGAYGFGDGHDKGRAGFDESMAYWELGLRSRYEVSALFNLGLNAKVMHAEDRTKKFYYPDLVASEASSNIWVSEIGVPFIWIFPKCSWDIQLEPYVLNFYTKDTQNIYGTRLLLGYRF